MSANGFAFASCWAAVGSASEDQDGLDAANGDGVANRHGEVVPGVEVGADEDDGLLRLLDLPDETDRNLRSEQDLHGVSDLSEFNCIVAGLKASPCLALQFAFKVQRH